MAKIKIKISADGRQISSEVMGIKGQSCVKVDEFMKSLGEAKFSKTSEYYDSPQDNDVQITNQS